VKKGAIKRLFLTALCLLLAGIQMARSGVNEDAPHAAKAAPANPSQPGTAMDAYFSWMQTNFDALEKNLPAITASADAAAEKYVTGEWEPVRLRGLRGGRRSGRTIRGDHEFPMGFPD
jgi:hypothetical protein